MFEFLNDLGNYAARKVDRLETFHGFISTCQVSDGAKPYETAVADSRYVDKNGNRMGSTMIIVEAYDSVSAAKCGHDRWVTAMTVAEELPQRLTDCNNAFGGLEHEVYGVLDLPSV
jgi:hypothetical protein